MPAHHLGERLVELRTGRPLRDALVDSLTRHGGNNSAVAAELGVTPVTVRRWRARFGIEVVTATTVRVEINGANGPREEVTA